VPRGLALDAAYSIERLMSMMIFSTEDAREGPKAFMEKRASLEGKIAIIRRPLISIGV